MQKGAHSRAVVENRAAVTEEARMYGRSHDRLWNRSGEWIDVYIRKEERMSGREEGRRMGQR